MSLENREDSQKQPMQLVHHSATYLLLDRIEHSSEDKTAEWSCSTE